ncbi:unnamed protein product [Psylliodes chrysocephalus]|uniref:Uncharacterized protein n=1 Tax=Psylliodes chrysocephalus TaxID=3402493 RepID=A0A9P0CF02_9CUCU|nr:unnamed protein product [Psylliodes chrysocephala]
MMKIILLILLSICTLLNAEQLRYKPRGPPQRRRSPPHRQFAKKWHQGGPLIQMKPHGLPPHGLIQGVPQGMLQFPLRGPPLRQKPMNHNLNNNHNHNNNMPMLLVAPLHLGQNKLPQGIPQGIPQVLQRPATPPIRNYWKNQVNNVQFPPEKVYVPQGPSQQVEKQKPFRSAPSLPVQEYDYHVQTNQIPHSHINPIKQIGEKGPIHTIPAPNLSLRDKPAMIHEVRNELSYQPQNIPYEQQRQEVSFQHSSPHEVRGEISFGHKIPQSTHVNIQKSHEYQVTEPSEHNQKLQRIQQEHQKQIQLQIQKQIEHMQKQNAQQESQQILIASDSIPLQHNLDQNPTGDIILSNNLSPKDLYQLVNANYPQAHQNHQLEHIQLFQPDGTFLEQFPQESIQASDKISFQPEFQSFNYDEQAHQKSLSKKDMSSLVSATYNLGSDHKETSSRNSEDALEQSELVQSYFDSRSDVSDNKIESDAKSKKDSNEEKLVGSYYSSLPNKEAAERLAQLQSAGKINSNLMKLSTNQNDSNESMTILIPDDDDDNTEAKNASEKENKDEFSDYEDEEDENMASEESAEFGHRIQPKKRAE